MDNTDLVPQPINFEVKRMLLRGSYRCFKLNPAEDAAS